MSKKSFTNLSTEELLSVNEAAEYLGVHAGTIRRWAYARKLKGSKLGSRGDWRFTRNQLLELATPNVTVAARSASLLDTVQPPAPVESIRIVQPGDHFVQFYEADEYLISTIVEYIQHQGPSLLVITPTHREMLENVVKPENLKQVSFLDARTTLQQILVGTKISKKKFQSVIEQTVRFASSDSNELRVFGEMVALLWIEGNQEAAVELESLWNELQSQVSFTLYCAYPIQKFSDISDTDFFNLIEGRHSHVIPSESYSRIADEKNRLRQIAHLQQKAQALEVEIQKHDETERLLLETVAALQASEEFNRKIIENSADCIKVLDISGAILSINQPGCAVMEIDDSSQFIGENYLNLWKGVHEVDALEALDTARRGLVGRFQGLCPTFKGTPKWWDVVITPMHEENNAIEKLLAISRDITSFKELDQRKEDFLSSTSHELKTPLTSQKAFLQLLQQRLQESGDGQYLRLVQKISQQTNKLTKLVKDLLDASKVQAGKLIIEFLPFFIHESIEMALDEVYLIADHNPITVEGTCSRMVIGDKEKVCQVLVNLLTNAVKYSQEQQSIKLSITEQEAQVIIAVTDYGMGIDTKDQSRIFERFYRVTEPARQSFPGLGMGLYIASEIVKQHNGEIWVKSRKGKGSMFSFSLPLYT